MEQYLDEDKIAEEAQYDGLYAAVQIFWMMISMIF